MVASQRLTRSVSVPERRKGLFGSNLWLSLHSLYSPNQQLHNITRKYDYLSMIQPFYCLLASFGQLARSI